MLNNALIIINFLNVGWLVIKGEIKVQFTDIAPDFSLSDLILKPGLQLCRITVKHQELSPYHVRTIAVPSPCVEHDTIDGIRPWYGDGTTMAGGCPLWKFLLSEDHKFPLQNVLT
jgi:hypothetical protein